MRRIKQLTLILTILLFITGCGNRNNDRPEFIAQNAAEVLAESLVMQAKDATNILNVDENSIRNQLTEVGRKMLKTRAESGKYEFRLEDVQIFEVKLGKKISTGMVNGVYSETFLVDLTVLGTPPAFVCCSDTYEFQVPLTIDPFLNKFTLGTPRT